MSSSFVDDSRFDGLYLNVAHQTKGIEPLLDTVFSFLRRKTDFFAGPPGSEDGTNVAIQKVNDVLKKHAQMYNENKSKSKSTNTSSSSKKSAKSKARASPIVTSKPPKITSEDDVVEMNSEGGFDVSSQSSPASRTKSPAPKTVDPPKKAEEKLEPEQESSDAAVGPDSGANNEKEDDGPPPIGNGGSVDGKYIWTQTLGELTVTIPVPDNTRGKDLIVNIERAHLRVALRSTPKDFIINAPLTKTVVCDDSFWTIEDGNRLVINLQKLNTMEWWDSVCAGDSKIDVRKIQPENSSLSDLDGETRKTVEKMMYDQRQKARGLPTSEEETKLSAIERFKKEHPELDFTNAKIT